MANAGNSTGDPPKHLITEPLCSSKPVTLANGDLRMAIAVAGQKAYNWWGEESTLSEEFLQKDFRTWENGLISTNHENTNDLLNGASLYDLEYDPGTTLVFASFANLPEKAKAFINSEFYQGLSQECIPLKYKNNSSDVIQGYGTGVTIVMWPHQPAANQASGVGVRPDSIGTGALSAILSSKYPTNYPINISKEEKTMSENPGGGVPAVSIDAYNSAISRSAQLESRVSALESDNKKLRDELDSAEKKYTEQVSGETNRTKIESERAVNAYKAELEKEGIVSELTGYLGDYAERYFSTNPSIETMKIDLEREKANSENKKLEASKNVGSSNSSEPAEEKTHVSCQFTPDCWSGKMNAEVK